LACAAWIVSSRTSRFPPPFGLSTATTSGREGVPPSPPPFRRRPFGRGLGRGAGMVGDAAQRGVQALTA
jgi:hypothetical protein